MRGPALRTYPRSGPIPWPNWTFGKRAALCQQAASCGFEEVRTAADVTPPPVLPSRGSAQPSRAAPCGRPAAPASTRPRHHHARVRRAVRRVPSPVVPHRPRAGNLQRGLLGGGKVVPVRPTDRPARGSFKHPSFSVMHQAISDRAGVASGASDPRRAASTGWRGLPPRSAKEHPWLCPRSRAP